MTLAESRSKKKINSPLPSIKLNKPNQHPQVRAQLNRINLNIHTNLVNAHTREQQQVIDTKKAKINKNLELSRLAKTATQKTEENLTSQTPTETD